MTPRPGPPNSARPHPLRHRRGRCAVGVLHSSFNATETLLDPDYDWVRIVLTIAVAVVIIASGRRPDPVVSSEDAAAAGGCWSQGWLA